MMSTAPAQTKSQTMLIHTHNLMEIVLDKMSNEPVTGMVTPTVIPPLHFLKTFELVYTMLTKLNDVDSNNALICLFDYSHNMSMTRDVIYNDENCHGYLSPSI